MADPKAAAKAEIFRLAESGADKLDAMVATLMGTKGTEARDMAKIIRREADAVRDCIRLAKAWNPTKTDA